MNSMTFLVSNNNLAIQLWIRYNRAIQWNLRNIILLNKENLKECKGNQTTHDCNCKIMIQKASDPLGQGP